MSLVQNTAWSAAAAIVLTGGRFLVTILLAEKLGVSEFGRFAFTQWLVDIVFLSMAIGLPGSASRYYSEFRSNSARLLAFERWFVSRACVVALIVAVASPLAMLGFGDGVDTRFALLQASWSFAAAVWGLSLARALGLQQFKRVAISNLTYVSVALGGSLALRGEGVDASSAIQVIVTATAMAAVVSWMPLPIEKGIRCPHVSDTDRRVLRVFSMNVWIAGVVSALVWSRGELVIVRTALGVSDVGLYATALSLTGIATQGVMLLTGAIGQHLTRLYAAGLREAAIDLCRLFTDILTVIAGALSILLIAFTPEVIRLTFGLEYLGATDAVAILGLGVVGFTSAAANQLLLLQTNGVFGRNANILAAIGLFLMAFPLVHMAGIEGAAIARTLAQIGAGTVTLVFVGRLVSRRSVNWVNQAKVALLVLMIACAGWLWMPTLGIRVVESSLALLVMVFWVRDDQGRSVMAGLLNRTRTAFTKHSMDRGPG